MPAPISSTDPADRPLGQPVERPVDRRTALRDRHHRAILEGAAALLAEGGSAALSVEALAARADVSRRTVFNHFPHLDDVVVALCAERFTVLGALVRQGVGAPPPEVTGHTHDLGDDEGAILFERAAAALVQADLFGAMTSVRHLLGADGGPEPQVLRHLLDALTVASDDMTAALREQHTQVPVIDVQIVVGQLISGFTVLSRGWLEQGAPADPAARTRWEAQLVHVIDRIRAGYSHS
ncbi:MAG TPA: TetR/AcrR family transcriptional regulator [Cellulomonas sp.]|uniref:TetR/AcrR family transcriptional regulator n=1 Tax=Cellulomonas sp. TaxID=40001 RepID=UPI002E2F2085|nr:TetR/AcrR family transcriptional regulator [Cellulomonas sp.]HEX5332510.1 TetR/AcrR family transcriptional regulator [Cellulomonas sp.]